MTEKKSWKDSFSFLEPDAITHKVNGQDIEFYPVSLKTLFEIKTIAKPLAMALGVLFEDKGRDIGSVSRNFHTPDGEHLDNEMIVEPISLDLAKLRATQRSESIQNLMEALTDEAAKKTLGKLIVESMKKHFEKDQAPPPLEFMNEIPANSLVDFLTGVAKANKGVLGPLADTLTGLWAKVQTKMKTALSDEENATESETSSPTEPTSESEKSSTEQAA